MGNADFGLRPGFSIDDRGDLGYGRIKAKFQSPRSAGAEYPYGLAEFEDEVENDEYEPSDYELAKAFAAKFLGDFRASDFLSFKSDDPFYYVAGNTRLGEVTGKSLVPIPDLYKNRLSVGGGSSSISAISPSSYKRTGTKNYNPPNAFDDISLADYLSDEGPAIKKLRKVIRGILLQS